jgi:hypothetical protein
VSTYLLCLVSSETKMSWEVTFPLLHCFNCENSLSACSSCLFLYSWVLDQPFLSKSKSITIPFFLSYTFSNIYLSHWIPGHMHYFPYSKEPKQSNFFGKKKLVDNKNKTKQTNKKLCFCCHLFFLEENLLLMFWAI